MREVSILIKYVCHNCNDLGCDTSKCPVCGSRTEVLESKIFWCTHCNAPSYEEVCTLCNNTCEYIGTDLRPVFPQERLLLEITENNPFKYANSSMWNVGGNHYIIDGNRKNFSYKEIIKNNTPESIIEKLRLHEKRNISYIENFLKKLSHLHQKMV